MGWLKHAFEISGSDALTLTPRQDEILDRLAAKVISGGCPFRDSLPRNVKPLNFVRSQVSSSSRRSSTPSSRSRITTR
jgi:hypothetical protein